MIDIEQALISVGKEKDKKNIETIIKKVYEADSNALQQFVGKRLGHVDAFLILHNIFTGLPTSGSSQVIRTKLIEHVLDTLSKKDLSTSEANKIINRLSCEMINMKTSQMVRFSQWCVENLQKSEQKHFAWKCLLPNLLNMLSKIGNVEFSGTEMSGPEYRRQVINSLCMTSWNSDIIVALADMFTDMDLAPDEHFQITYKLCQGIQNLDPSLLPPLVHQLLLLTVGQHSLQVFLHLQQYFTRHIYDRIRNGAQETCSDDVISDDILTGKKKELMRTESTIFFYVNQAVTVGTANIKDLLNSLRNSTTAPENCLNPFFVTLLLSISSVTCYEEQVLDIIKCNVTRVLAEDKRKQRSAWLQEVTPPSYDVERLIDIITESCGKERELIREGFVKLAFTLLCAHGHQSKDGHGRQVWKFGRLILVRLVRKYNNVAPTVVEQLSNHIVRGPQVSQHADTLLKLSVGAPLMLSECQRTIKQLIELLLQLPGQASQQVVVSVMPLARTYPTIRDCLMLVLRKAAYRCNVAVRLMAVKGFLLLLKTLDSKSLAIAATQSTQSTQNSMSEVHSEPLDDGEGVGMEVIGMLRRCITQQDVVRRTLYRGLFDAVSQNAVIYPYVTDFLLDVLEKYYHSDEIVQPPFDFDKIVSVNDMNVVLQEPIADLIFSIQRFVTKFNDKDQMDSNKSLKQLKEILDLLCRRMSLCTLENMGFEEGVNLADILPESKRMNEIFHQALGIYEALIAYVLSAWSTDSKDRHQTVNSLFRSYVKLLDFGKNAVKPAKNENKVPKGQRKKSLDKSGDKSFSKAKSLAMRKISTVLDIKAVILLLQALFEESVSWAKEEDLLPMRNKREFCRYALQVTLQILQEIHNTKYSELQIQSGLFNYCSQVGRIIYRRFLHVDEDADSIQEEDPPVIVLAVECFHELLATILCHFESQLPQFLESTGEVEYSKGLGEQILVPINCIQKRFIASLEEEIETDSDPVLKKLPVFYISLISQLALQLPRHSPVASQVFAWLKKFVADTTMTNIAAAKETFSLLFKLSIHIKDNADLFENVALQLLNLMESIDSETPIKQVSRFAALTEFTQLVCLQQLCAGVKHMLDDIDWMITRSKGMLSSRAYPSTQTSEQKAVHLREQEQGICMHLCRCVKVVTTLVRALLPEGPAMDVVVKLLISFYNTASNLAKYFCNRSSKSDLAFQTARFTYVVQLTAVELAQHVQWLLLHVMGEVEEDSGEKRKKKKNSDKTNATRELKDSKLFPRIVYGMEMFEKNVILLSKKCNVNLMKHVKVHSGRDFRIKMNVVQSVLENENQEENNEEQEVEDEQEQRGEQEQTDNQNAEDQLESSQNESLEDDDDDQEHPKPKKRRTVA